MKRISTLIGLLLLSLALCACGGPKEEPGDLTMFGIDWSATPEQASEVLKLPDDALVGGILTVQDTEFFEAAVQKAEFQFIEDSKGQLRLSRIQLIYPDDADMARVRKALEKAYGPGLEQYQEYDHNRNLRIITATDSLAFWHSNKTMTACSADPAFPLREDWQTYRDAMQAQDEKAGANGRLVEFYEQSPVVRLFWTDDGQIPYIQGDQPKNAVYFDASLLAVMR